MKTYPVITTCDRWIAEVGRIYRFVIVGLFATAVHVSVAWTLIVYANMPPLAANLNGFGLAFALSFVGQYFWTFRSNRRLLSAMLRFALIASAGFSVNNLVLWLTLQANLFPDATATVAAAGVIPVASYLGNRFWALR
jgi:putative flippase GtrA